MRVRVDNARGERALIVTPRVVGRIARDRFALRDTPCVVGVRLEAHRAWLVCDCGRVVRGRYALSVTWSAVVSRFSVEPRVVVLRF